MILPCSRESVKRIATYARENPVIIPTDTLYGLSMSIEGDITRVFELKKRPVDKPIPIGVSNIEMMESLGHITKMARILVENFMPGALTIVVKSRSKVPWNTVALRIPAHPIPLALIEEIGPITLTSANISGDKPPTSIEDTLKLNVAYRVDCGVLPGTPSTVVSVVGGEIKLIREGAIPIKVIRTFLEETE